MYIYKHTYVYVNQHNVCKIRIYIYIGIILYQFVTTYVYFYMTVDFPSYLLQKTASSNEAMAALQVMTLGATELSCWGFPETLPAGRYS